MKKVLIICAGLCFGGVERFAANISLFAPADEFRFDYLVFDNSPTDFEEEVAAKGAHIIRVPSPSVNHLAYIKKLSKMLKSNKYDVIHSHTQFNSGLNLWVAKKNGVPIRIAHSHTTAHENHISFPKKCYEKIMRIMIKKYATHFCACGVQAGEWMYGKHPFIVINNGIDTNAFAYSDTNRKDIRDKYNISEEAFVIGHSGTLSPLKNQEFLIRLMPEIKKQKPDSYLLLLGNGDEGFTKRLADIAAKCGVEDSVIFAGAVHNVNEFLSAFDVFAFPSLREGTPLALLEAQTNGLPCVISDAIPKDVCLTGLMHRLQLKDKLWVNEMLCLHRDITRDSSQEIRTAGYDVSEAYSRIYKIYNENNIGIVAFSFDDGRKDNYSVAKEILEKYKLPATFNITAGFVDGSCPEELKPTKYPAMSVDEVIEIGNNPLFEIALHGNNHLNTISDIAEGREKVMKWFDLKEPIKLGFASLGSGLEINDNLFDNEPFKSGVSYVRTSLRIKKYRFLRIIARKAGRVIHLPLFYRIAYADTLLEKGNGSIIYSIPVMGDVTVSQIKSIIDLCIKQRKAVVLMFHSIEEKPKDTWSWSERKFTELCEYLKENIKKKTIEVCTVQKVYDETM